MITAITMIEALGCSIAITTGNSPRVMSTAATVDLVDVTPVTPGISKPPN